MKKITPAFFFFLALLATSWALLHSGFFRVHDYVHAARIAEMLRALQDGEFPVRWTPDFGFGYGMPLFEFYAPLPFYVGTFFYWLGLHIILVLKLLFVLCSVGTFVGMYLLGKKLYGRIGGILSAVALTVAPYRAVDLYVRGALSEAWGIMALPWVLLGIVKVIRREKNGWLVLVFGLFLLILSHNITTLLFFPISIVFALGFWLSEYIRKRALIKTQVRPILQLIGAYSLAIGICAFYIFPSLAENSFTRVNGIFTGYFHYTNHFLYYRQFFEDRWGYGGSAIWPYNGISYFLGYGQFFGLAVTFMTALYFFFKKIRKQFSRLTVSQFFFLFLCLGLFIFALFMTTFKSQFIWDALPFMVVVQFPWRWLSVATVFLSLILGMSTYFINSKWQRGLYVGVLSIFLLMSNARFFQPEFYLDTPEKFYYTDSGLIRTYMSQVLNDYVPKQIAFLPDPVNQLAISHSKYGGVKVLVNKTQEKLIQTNFTIPNEQIEVTVADFPGWKVFIDGKEVEKHIGPAGDFLVNVPQGEHTVGLVLSDSPIRFWSDAVSAVSCILLLFLVIDVRKEKKVSV